jgi:hypothetical protein
VAPRRTHSGPQRKAGERATETQCQKTVFDAVKQFPGWLVHHGRPAPNGRGRFITPIQGKAGFPDLTMMHPGRGIALFVELKRYPNDVEPDQMDWLLAMRHVGLDARIWWVPEDLDELVAVVVGAPLPTPRPLVEMVAGPANDPRRGQQRRIDKSVTLIRDGVDRFGRRVDPSDVLAELAPYLGDQRTPAAPPK